MHPPYTEVDVQFACALDTRSRIVPGAMEAYWEGATIGIDVRVRATIRVLGSFDVPISYGTRTTVSRGVHGGKEEVLVFGSDGQVLDGFDTGLEKGLLQSVVDSLEGEGQNATKGGAGGAGAASEASGGPQVVFGDGTAQCPSGTDLSFAPPSVYMCSVWVSNAW